MPNPEPHASDNPVGTGTPPEAERVGRSDLPASIEEALRRERERVAQVLHNTICQELTGFHYLASALAIRCEASSPAATEKLQVLAEKIQTAGRKLGEFINTLRDDERS